MEEGTVVTPPSQTIPSIRKKDNYRKIAKLLPAIAFYAMENGILPARTPVLSKKDRQRSSEG